MQDSAGVAVACCCFVTAAPHFASSSRYAPHQRSFRSARIIHCQIRAWSSALTFWPSPLSSRSHMPKCVPPLLSTWVQQTSGFRWKSIIITHVYQAYIVLKVRVWLNIVVACHEIHNGDILETAIRLINSHKRSLLIYNVHSRNGNNSHVKLLHVIKSPRALLSHDSKLSKAETINIDKLERRFTCEHCTPLLLTTTH